MGVAASLGFDLGRVAMPCTNLACAPRLAAVWSNPPMSISADQVGVQVKVLPANSIPPKPSACYHMAMNRQWVPPPPFSLSGVKRLSWANSNIFTPFSGGGGGGVSPHFCPGNSACHPHHPRTTPSRMGLSTWTTPPSSTHTNLPAPTSL